MLLNRPRISTILQTLVTLATILLLLFVLRMLTPFDEGELSTTPFAPEEERLSAAHAVLNGSYSARFRPTGADDPRRLLMAVVASERTGHYLTSVLAGTVRVFEGNDAAGSRRKRHRPTTTDSQLPAIIICNTADAARRFPELKSLEDRFEVVDLNPTTHIYSNDVDGRIRKEADDYWKCLNATHRLTTADYVMLLEDDALPTPAFPVLLESLARRLDERPHIDYVKLYHPWSLRKLPSLIQAAVFCAVLAWTVHSSLWRRQSAFAVVAVSILSFLAVRNAMPDVFTDMRFAITRSAYLTPSESCCTPAVLFRSASIPAMVAELSREPAKGGHAKDHILDESRFAAHGIDRNAVLHIGLFSSVRQKMGRQQEDWRDWLRTLITGAQ